MKYGDQSNAFRDINTLHDIYARQGVGIFLEVIAERVGQAAAKFKFNDVEIERVRESILTELTENISERV